MSKQTAFLYVCIALGVAGMLACTDELLIVSYYTNAILTGLLVGIATTGYEK